MKILSRVGVGRLLPHCHAVDSLIDALLRARGDHAVDLDRAQPLDRRVFPRLDQLDGLGQHLRLRALAGVSRRA